MAEPTPGLDTIVDLCRDKDRRIVLAVLAERQQPVPLDDLAKAIVRHNADISSTEATDETTTRIKTSLYHCHVPKLADAGLVEYDADRELVEPEAAFERIEPHIASIPEVDLDSERSAPAGL